MKSHCSGALLFLANKQLKLLCGTAGDGEHPTRNYKDLTAIDMLTKHIAWSLTHNNNCCHPPLLDY